MLPIPLDRSRAMSSSVMASRVQATDRRGFLVHERLHTQADAIHITAKQDANNFAANGSGRTLDRDLRSVFDLKVLADRPKQTLQLIGGEHRRRASAEIDRINGTVQRFRRARAPDHWRKQSRRTPGRHSGQRARAKTLPKRSCKNCTSCGRTAPRCKFLVTSNSRNTLAGNRVAAREAQLAIGN